jgi:hypothetical protein
MSVFQRTFPHPNFSNDWKCPLCQTAEDRPVVLAPILGTLDDGIEEARQIHADCLEHALRGALNP